MLAAASLVVVAAAVVALRDGGMRAAPRAARRRPLAALRGVAGFLPRQTDRGARQHRRIAWHVPARALRGAGAAGSDCPARPGQQADLRLLARAADPHDGEIRGEFWDLGRLSDGDTAFAAYDFRPLLENVTEGRWPRAIRYSCILGATPGRTGAARYADAARDRARTGKVREPQRDDLRPIPRPQPARRHRDAAADPEQVGLRRAVG